LALKAHISILPKKRLYLGGFLVISSLWLYANRQQVDISNKVDKRPDYELINANYTSTDNKGHVTTRLKSEHIVKQQADDFSTANKPIVTTGTAFSSHWTITAESAFMPESLEYVLLEGTTNIKGNLPNSTLYSTTSELKITAANGIAQTTQASTLLSENANLSGNGMTIHLKENTLELHHDVKGTISVNTVSN